MKYDFVIIGTGPSGSVIASNLAKKGFKIAMIDRATNIKSISDNTSFIFSILYHKILRNSR
jgi:flavin-dependent dehydrogenase